jgi:hypothetical protein
LVPILQSSKSIPGLFGLLAYLLNILLQLEG